jgi:hypothetical protein
MFKFAEDYAIISAEFDTMVSRFGSDHARSEIRQRICEIQEEIDRLDDTSTVLRLSKRVRQGTLMHYGISKLSMRGL